MDYFSNLFGKVLSASVVRTELQFHPDHASRRQQN